MNNKYTNYAEERDALRKLMDEGVQAVRESHIRYMQTVELAKAEQRSALHARLLDMMFTGKLAPEWLATQLLMFYTEQGMKELVERLDEALKQPVLDDVDITSGSNLT